jgi:Pretoxin HINT domain/Putative Ig domain
MTQHRRARLPLRTFFRLPNWMFPSWMRWLRWKDWLVQQSRHRSTTARPTLALALENLEERWTPNDVYNAASSALLGPVLGPLQVSLHGWGDAPQPAAIPSSTGRPPAPASSYTPLPDLGFPVVSAHSFEGGTTAPLPGDDRIWTASSGNEDLLLPNWPNAGEGDAPHLQSALPSFASSNPGATGGGGAPIAAPSLHSSTAPPAPLASPSFQDNATVTSMLAQGTALAGANGSMTPLVSSTPISVFGTGVNDSGALLSSGAIDPHWQLVSAPSPDTAGAVQVTQTGQFPFPRWAADGPSSAWISPHANENPQNGGSNEPVGAYDYRTSFDLTGFDPTTASLSGQIWADNTVTAVRINNQAATFTPNGGNDFASPLSFSVTSGFISGINTLDVVVSNTSGTGNNPSGVRVDLSGTAVQTTPRFAVYGTGLGTNDQQLADGAVDPHYQLISAPSGENTTGSNAYVTNQGSYPFPSWAADGPSSKWISPEANENYATGGAVDAPGNYVYETTFDLTGYDPTTAAITGLVSGDNTLVSVSLNDQDVGYSSSNGSQFTGLTPITISSGFVDGVNTLKFMVVNAAGTSRNPTGLRTELTGTAQLAQSVTLSSLANQSNSEGQAASAAVSASEPIPTGTMTYSASGLPGGLSINSSTGVIGGTLWYSDATSGSTTTYTPTIKANDGHGGITSETLLWTVADVNRLPTVSTQSNTVGDTISLNMAGTDLIASDSLTYSASELPGGLNINSSTGLISGVLNYNDSSNGTVSTYHATVTLTDNHGGTDTRALSWNVQDAFFIPSVFSWAGREGQSVSFTPFSPGSGSGLSFTAKNLPPGLSIDPASGLISGVVGYNAVDSETASLQFYASTVTLSDGAFVLVEWVVRNTDPIAPLADRANVEGDSVSFAVGAELAPGSFTYSATGLPSGVSIDPVTGVVSGLIAFSAEATGSDDVDTPTISVTGEGVSEVLPFDWYVSDTNRFPSVDDQTDLEGDSVSLALTVPGSSGFVYSATGLPAGVSIDPSTGLVTGTIAVADAGSYSPTFTLTDSQGTSDTLVLSWEVFQAGRTSDELGSPPPDGTSESYSTDDSVGPLASLGDQVSVEGDVVSLDLNLGDSTTTFTYSASGLPTGLSIDPSLGLISGTVSASFAPGAETSDFTATFTYTDSNNQPNALTFFWDVFADAPSGNGSGDSQSTPPLDSFVPPNDQFNSVGDTILLPIQPEGSSASFTYSVSGLPPGVTLDPSTGAFTGRISYTAANDGSEVDYTVSLGVMDDQGDTISTSFVWAVLPDDRLSTFTDQANSEGAVVSLAPGAVTPTGTATYSADGLPPGLTIDPVTGIISGTVGYQDAPPDDSADFTVTVTLSDGNGIESQTFAWSITDVNRLSTVADQDNAEGDKVSLNVGVPGSFTYSASELPPGLNIDPNTGLISGTISPGVDPSGDSFEFWCAVTLTDSLGGVDETEFGWKVESSPFLGSVAAWYAAEGQSVSLSIGDANSGSGLVYGATGLPQGLTIDPSTGVISGIVAYSQVDQSATGPSSVEATITVRVGSTSETFLLGWLIGNTNRLPQLDDQSNQEGDVVSLDLSATGTTTGLTYTESGLPPGLTLDPSSGLLSGTIGYNAADASTDGYYYVTIVLDGGQGGVDSRQFSWGVEDVNRLPGIDSQVNAEGDSVSLAVPENGGGTGLSYTASGLPAGLTIDPLSGIISGVVADGDVGTYDPTIYLSDAQGVTDSLALNWEIDPRELIDPVTFYSSAEGDTVSFGEGEAVSGVSYGASGLPGGLAIDPSTGLISGVLSFGDVAPDADSSDYFATITAVRSGETTSVTIDFLIEPANRLPAVEDQEDQAGQVVSLDLSTQSAGTGLTYSVSGLPTGLSINPSTGLVSGVIDPGASGDYDATVTLTDGQGNVDERAFDWDVDPLAPFSLPDQMAAEGEPISLALGFGDGSGITYSATGLPSGISMDPVSGLLSGTVAYSGSDDLTPVVYTPTLTIADSLGEVEVGTFSWVIMPTPQEFSLGAWYGTEGDTVSLSVAEPSASAGLTYVAEGLPSGLTLDASTGVVSGIVGDDAVINPGGAEYYGALISATDSNGNISLQGVYYYLVSDSSPSLPNGDSAMGAGFLDGSNSSTGGGTIGSSDGANSFAASDVTSLSSDSGGGSSTTGGTSATTPGLIWSDQGSPYYARNILEAKDRAWRIASAAGATNDSAVGAAVGRAFRVDPNDTWGTFYPDTSRQSLVAQRENSAGNTSLILLARLDADWLQASAQGASRNDSIGETEALRWRSMPSFFWAEASTSWGELYTTQMADYLAAARAKPMPHFYQASFGTLPTSTLEMYKLMWVTSPKPGQPAIGYSVLNVLQNQLLPRLAYTTPAALADYVQNTLTADDRVVLLFALDSALAGLQSTISDTTDKSRLAELYSEQLLYQNLYSELSRAMEGSAYGLSTTTATAFQSFLAAINPSNPLVSPNLTQFGQGSIAQRLAFLADTDYETFAAREKAADPEHVDDIPTARQYYGARSLLLDAVENALATGKDVLQAIARVLNPYIDPPTTYTVYVPATSGPPFINVLWSGNEERTTPGLANPYYQAAQFISDRYLRGNTGVSAAAFYTLDRYSQANLGLTYLAGWTNPATTDAERQNFADHLWPLDRQALVESLGQAAVSLRDTGDLYTAEAARSMAAYLVNRFNSQLATVQQVTGYDPPNALWTTAFNAASDKQRIIRGLSAVLFGVHLQIYNQLNPSIQMLAVTRAVAADSAFRIEHPVEIKYDPVTGLTFLDLTLLHAAEFLAPAYRTGLRVYGVGQGLITGDYKVTDEFSNLSGIGKVIGGDLTADVQAQALTYGLGETLWDGAQTALMVLPVGGGSRAVISGGRFLPASLGLARSQVLSAARHLGVSLGAAATGSLGMAAVDSSGLPEQIKAPLRLVAGLGMALASGIALERALPSINSELVSVTRQLAAAETRLASLKDASDAARKTATELVDSLKSRLGKIRARVGEGVLTEAENGLNAATQQLEQAEAKAAAPGLSPSERAALRSGELKAAQTAYKQAYQKVTQLYELTVLQPSCFVAGTPLLTPGGSKVIEQFRPGDLVLSRSEFEPEGPVEPKRVEEVFVRTAAVLELRVGGRSIRTTAEHPFYVAGRGWIPAGMLAVGDPLTQHEGLPIPVEAVSELREIATVYNLRVADYHTYFVGCQAWGFSVWAHNADYVLVPYEDGYRLAEKIGENAYRLVTEGGTNNTIRFFKNETLATEAVESAGGAIIAGPRSASAGALTNALRNFQSRKYLVGGHTFQLDRSGMRHILEGHHLKFFNGEFASRQSFFDRNTTMTQIESLIGEILAQDPARVRAIGAGQGGFRASVGGVEYQITLDSGRIVQFFPFTP